MYESLLPLLSFGTDQLTNNFQSTDFFCDCIMLCVFCCYVYVSILQCSTTRTALINAFQIFYIFLVLYLTYSSPLCSYLNPVLHGNGLTFAIACTV